MCRSCASATRFEVNHERDIFQPAAATGRRAAAEAEAESQVEQQTAEQAPAGKKKGKAKG